MNRQIASRWSSGRGDAKLGKVLKRVGCYPCYSIVLPGRKSGLIFRWPPELDPAGLPRYRPRLNRRALRPVKPCATAHVQPEADSASTAVLERDEVPHIFGRVGSLEIDRFHPPCVHVKGILESRRRSVSKLPTRPEIWGTSPLLNTVGRCAIGSAAGSAAPKRNVDP